MAQPQLTKWRMQVQAFCQTHPCRNKWGVKSERGKREGQAGRERAREREMKEMRARAAAVAQHLMPAERWMGEEVWWGEPFYTELTGNKGGVKSPQYHPPSHQVQHTHTHTHL